jgi:hypothetical protein
MKLVLHIGETLAIALFSMMLPSSLWQRLSGGKTLE